MTNDTQDFYNLKSIEPERTINAAMTGDGTTLPQTIRSGRITESAKGGACVWTVTELGACWRNDFNALLHRTLKKAFSLGGKL